MAANIENRGPTLLVLDAFFLGMAVVAMSLRCYVRLVMVKAWGIDDSIMAIAMVFYSLYASFSMHGVTYGTGRHMSDLTVENRQIAMKSWWFCYLWYASTMIASKLSIGYFMLRVTVRKLHKWIIYAAVLISIVAGVAFFFASLFQCHPIAYFWTRYGDGTGVCLNSDVIIGLAYLYSVFSIISDLTLAILPAFLISKLQMNRRTKLALIPLMAMGTIASLGLVVRLPFLMKLRDVDDFLWATLDIAVWSTVEGGLAITAGSLATTRPLFKIVMQKLGVTSSSPLGPSGPLSGEQASNTFKRGHRGVRSNGDIYALSHVDEGKNSGWVDSGSDNAEEDKSYGIRTQIVATKPGKSKTQGRSESQEELRPEISKDGELRGGAVVAKSFLITEETR